MDSTLSIKRTQPYKKLIKKVNSSKAFNKSKNVYVRHNSKKQLVIYIPTGSYKAFATKLSSSQLKTSLLQTAKAQLQTDAKDELLTLLTDAASKNPTTTAASELAQYGDTLVKREMQDQAHHLETIASGMTAKRGKLGTILTVKPSSTSATYSETKWNTRRKPGKSEKITKSLMTKIGDFSIASKQVQKYYGTKAKSIVKANLSTGQQQ